MERCRLRCSRVYPKKNCLLSLPVFSLLDLISSVSGRHIFSLCIIKRDPVLLKEMRVGWPWPHSLITYGFWSV